MVSHDGFCDSWTREEADRRARGVVVTHPNRDKAVVQSTRLVVILLLLVTIALLLINTIGGWKVLQGALPVQLGFIVVYILMVYYAARWSRGVLPLAAALGVLLVIFALAAAPSGSRATKPGSRSRCSTPG